MNHFFKKLLFHLFFAAFFAQSAAAQCPTFLTLKSQGAVDSFALNFPGCDFVQYSLTISGADITNLDGLSVLKTVKGGLSIERCPMLASLDGLSQIASIGHGLLIDSVPLLTDLHGLENLKSIGPSGFLGIARNGGLTSLNGLQGLKTIESAVDIYANNALTSLHGLDSLRFVKDKLQVGYNPMLHNLEGLNRLDSVGNTLIINNNNGLKTLDGLDRFQATKKLTITQHAALESILGLQNFKKAESVVINSNNALLHLDGLGGLASVKTLDLNNNDRLERLTAFPSLKKLDLLNIAFCDSLKSILGLEQLNSVKSDLKLTKLGKVTDLNGLNGLQKVGGDLDIIWMRKLESPVGLDSLVFIGGNLKFYRDSALSTLVGLNDSLEIGGSLSIYVNPLLSICEAVPVCRFLAKPNADFSIYSNKAGCQNAVEIQSACGAVGIDFYAEKTAFEISPNPISDGQPLQILLENDFFGMVKFEILSLDGRVLHTFFEEKTNRLLNVGRVLNPSDVGGSAFFIRVSDGKTSATRLVLKF